MAVWIALLAVFIGLATVLKARQSSASGAGRSSDDASVHADNGGATGRDHDHGDADDGGDSGDGGGGDGD